MPRGYFDEDAAAALAAFRQQALENRGIDLLSSFPVAIAEQTLAHPWLAPAVGIYANWLSCLVEQKSRKLGVAKASPLRECIEI